MGSTIKNILYATDLSRNSGYVFRYALDAAEKHGARIHILHVFERPAPSGEAELSARLPNFREIRKNNMNEMAARIHKGLNEFERESGRDSRKVNPIASMLVAEGDPAEEILKKADQWNCEVIIMGTHGKGLVSTLFGSVSEKVLHQTRRPVHIIPIPKGGNGVPFSEF